MSGGYHAQHILAHYAKLHLCGQHANHTGETFGPESSGKSNRFVQG